MKDNGSQYYDNDDFFRKYTLKRESKDNANDTIEKPIFQELVGNVSGLYILDLGCGDGKYGVKLLQAGSAGYLGLEGSNNMYNLAVKNLEIFEHGNVVHSTLEDYDFPESRYDLVVSRLVLHYIENIDTLFEKIYCSLKDGGRFIFSIEHSVITSTLQTVGQRTGWLVDQYFSEGIRDQIWLDPQVYKYHRTIETYFLALQNVGFNIEKLRESKPLRQHFKNADIYERRLTIPWFLFMAGKK
ncbi:SAM-dependent methyltransferase [Bacillus sp. V33-4]|nr:SAM-dependent methyltransferase [Bacillus sp. V33-4]